MVQVADSSWLVLREQGALVEEAVDGDGDGDEKYNEKDVLAGEAVHDIVVGVVSEDDGGDVRKEVNRIDADGDPPFLRWCVGEDQSYCILKSAKLFSAFFAY